MKAEECKGCYFWSDELGHCCYFGSSYKNVKAPCVMRRVKHEV